MGREGGLVHWVCQGEHVRDVRVRDVAPDEQQNTDSGLLAHQARQRTQLGAAAVTGFGEGT
jgi:hypothetical protein